MNNLIPTEKNSNLAQQMNNYITYVDYFVRRSYLSNLTRFSVQPYNQTKSHDLRLYHIEKIIYDREEDVNEKLASVYSAMRNINTPTIMLIDGSDTGVNFYLGAKVNSTSGIAGDLLKNSFTANFPGSSCTKLMNEEVNKVLAFQNFNNISSVTVVPSQRKENDKNYIQGIEKLIDAMQGKRYTAIFIANPVSAVDIVEKKRGLEQLYSSLSPFAKSTLAYGENQSEAVSQGTFTNFTSTINESITKTIGNTLTEGDTKSSGSSIAGTTYSKGISQNVSYSESESNTQGTSTSSGSGSNNSTSSTTGTTKTVTIETTNKTVNNLLECIDEQFERLRNFDALGAWETSAYFCADKIENSVVAASIFKALVSGDESNVENAHINTWESRESVNRPLIAEYLRNFSHPQFIIPQSGILNKQIVTPANNISGIEIPVFMGIPQKSVAGISVTSMADFSRNVSKRGVSVKEDTTQKIELGCIHHMGTDELNNPVLLDLNNFTSHCFVTGSTGSGKSNTTYCLLERFIENKIPFLVIEPAKGEYKTQFGDIPGINIFNTNQYLGPMLKINPFEFRPEIHVLEHLDMLIDVFNACWEMYAAMPAILKSAIEKAYVNKGWDLQNSVYLNQGKPQYPTFADVLSTLPKVIGTTSYSSDSKGDYTGALVTRVESLTNGISGQIFCDDYFISDKTLFDENTIIDLSRIGSNETKSLIMGILVIKLTEYRRATTNGSNKKLEHITVLEEAHNLLKNVSHTQGQQTANPVGKSVEMLCNSIAEMRTYGEGFVIVDQSPTSVDIAAIKNTNTKIVMHLPEKEDCQAIGNSLGLTDDQISELSKLPVGVGAVMQNNWLETVLCKVKLAEGDYYKETDTADFKQISALRSNVLEYILKSYKQEHSIDYDGVCKIIDDTYIAEPFKEEMKLRTKILCENASDSTDATPYYISLLYLSGLINLFRSSENEIIGKEFDSDFLENWGFSILDKLNLLYMFKDDALYKTLFKRCLFAMRWMPGTVDYTQAYRSIYENR